MVNAEDAGPTSARRGPQTWFLHTIRQMQDQQFVPAQSQREDNCQIGQ